MQQLLISILEDLNNTSTDIIASAVTQPTDCRWRQCFLHI